MDLDWDNPGAAAAQSSSQSSAQNDLQDLFSPSSPQQTQQQTPVAAKPKSNVDDIMGLFGSSAPASAPQASGFQQPMFQQSPPQQQQQLQQNLFGGDLLFDTQPAAQPTSPPQQQQQAQKDPFADLF